MLGSLPNIGNTENIHQQTFFWKQGIQTNPQIFLVSPSEENNKLEQRFNPSLIHIC